MGSGCTGLWVEVVELIQKQYLLSSLGTPETVPSENSSPFRPLVCGTVNRSAEASRCEKLKE